MEPRAVADVITEITQAFPAPPLEPEDAFEGNVYLDAARFKAESRGKPWTGLDVAFLEFHHDAISFLAPAAYAAYLPAYLAATVAPDERVDVMPVSLLRTLTRSADSRSTFDARLDQLSPSQQLAVARALEHLGTSLDEGLWRRSARRALASYWRELSGRR
jgi:hypothetical protein